MYKFILAFRYLYKRRISYLASLAVALCVFIVVIVMTVMTGLVDDYKQKNHKFIGDCILTSDSLVGFGYYEDFLKILEYQDFIAAASPVIKTYAMITYPDSGRSTGVELMGVDPIKHSHATGFGQSVHYNKNHNSQIFVPNYDSTLDGCVLGIDIWLQRDSRGSYHFSKPYKAAFAISTFPLTAKGALAYARAGEVKTATFYYSDVSHSGLARIDGTMIYIDFKKAQQLCGMAGQFKRINAIHVKFKDAINIHAGRDKLQTLFDDYKASLSEKQYANLLDHVKVQTWRQNRRTFIAAMEKEQKMMAMMFLFIGITTVFVVFAVFYLIVNRKSKDIGILKSLGISASGIVSLYSIFAFMLAVFSSILGSFAAWLFLLKINNIENWLYVHTGFQLWDRSIYAIGDIPSKIGFNLLVVVIFYAILACLMGAFFPTWRAVRLKPVEILQVNQL